MCKEVYKGETWLYIYKKELHFNWFTTVQFLLLLLIALSSVTVTTNLTNVYLFLCVYSTGFVA